MCAQLFIRDLMLIVFVWCLHDTRRVIATMIS